MKILILAYDFPPYISVGALRPYSWYKYLHEFGIHPVVVTRQWDNKYGNHLDYIAPGNSSQTIIEKSEQGTIIRTPYFPNLSNRLLLNYGESKFKLLRKFTTAYYEFAQWFFLTGPKSQLYIAANDYLSTNKVDVIIATGDPFILFKYASKLSNEFNIPWIADYRDLWSNDISMQKKFLIKIFNTLLERKIVKKANLITTVSDFLKYNIKKIVNDRQLYILPNGYDSEAAETTKNIQQQNAALTISYVGIIWKWHPLRIFFSMISSFVKDTKEVKIKLNFYGINNESEIRKMIKSDFPELNKIVLIYSKVPNNLLLKELAKFNLMLLFNDYSHIGTKIYDYLCINRTILLCYADDEEARKLKEKYYTVKEIEGISSHAQEDLIKETNSGYVVKDAKHLYDLLGKLYDEFLKNGYIKCNTKNIEKYSRKEQAKKLAEIIKNTSVPNKR